MRGEPCTVPWDGMLLTDENRKVRYTAASAVADALVKIIYRRFFILRGKMENFRKGRNKT